MKKKSTASLCIVIPLLVKIGIVIAFGLAGILEVPTERGTVYSILMYISIFGLILLPIPSMSSSIVGIIRTAELRKQGKKTGYLILIGIFNIVVSFIVEFTLLKAIFIADSGV